MFTIAAGVRRLGLLLLVITLNGCGGGSNESSPVTYTVGGSVTGLVSGTTVTLQNNGGNNTPVAVNASFSFSSGVASGASYEVTVLTQPVGQVCSVAKASGVIGSANVSVAVTCVPNPYTVGGTVTGLLPGNVLSLADNTSLGVSVTANGAFTFTPAQPSGLTYTVAVAPQGQPAGQTCSVANGSGTIAGANVTNVTVSCTTTTYQINVSVLGQPTVTGLVLQDNGGDNLTPTTGGNYTFSTRLAYGSNYSVSILTQPTGSTIPCFVSSNASGGVPAANVSVAVTCPWHVAYFAGYANTGITGAYVDGTTGMLFGSVTGGSAGNWINSFALDPAGPFLYAGTFTEDLSSPLPTIGGFAIDPTTGNLTPVTGSPYNVQDGCSSNCSASVATDPAGTYLYTYLTNANSNPPPVYAINSSTGALTLFTGTPPSAPSQNPPVIVVESSGSYEYSISGSSITASAINSGTGALTPVVGSPFPVDVSGLGSCSITADPSGKFLYAFCVNNLSDQYEILDIDPSTGALSTIAADPIQFQSIAYMIIYALP